MYRVKIFGAEKLKGKDNNEKNFKYVLSYAVICVCLHNLYIIITTSIYFSPFWRQKSKIKVSVGLVSGEIPLPGSNCCVFRWQKGIREFSGVSFIRTLNLIQGGSTLMTYHHPKTPPPNAITLGVKISILRFGRGHKHSVYSNWITIDIIQTEKIILGFSS